MEVIRQPLTDGFGVRRDWVRFRFGRADARPAAYLQAGLHADEPVGQLALHRLARRLTEAEQAGDLVGRVDLVPCANPIGASQFVHGTLVGRFDLNERRNFNRNFPDLGDAINWNALGDASDPAEFRAALVNALNSQPPIGAVERLQAGLLAMALEADLVIDLHCEGEARPHLYVGRPLWSRQVRKMAAILAIELVLIEEPAVAAPPFDQACAGPWWRRPNREPMGPIAMTWEMGGRADVALNVADRDAERLWDCLVELGATTGGGTEGRDYNGPAFPLTAVDVLRAPADGLVVWEKALGDWVEAGDSIGRVIDPCRPSPAWSGVPIETRASGLFFAREQQRFAREGQKLGKVAGQKDITQPGGPLGD